jgi:hypothetical protein
MIHAPSQRREMNAMSTKTTDFFETKSGLLAPGEGP